MTRSSEADQTVSNKRYDMGRRADLARKESPGAPPVSAADSLGPDELSFKTDPPKRPRQPIPVLVWLRIGGISMQTPAECLEFTSKAALVRYTRPGGPAEQVWVWASAVTRT